MKLKKNTLLLILCAVILGGGVFILEARNQQQVALITQQRQIFDFNQEDIKKITIQYSDTTLEIVPIDRNWRAIEPEETIVNDGVMAFLLDLILEGKSDLSLTIPSVKLAEYALESPLGIINIELKNGEFQQILLGKETIDSNLIYALVNPQTNQSNTEILLVSKNWLYAIARDFAEWKN